MPLFNRFQSTRGLMIEQNASKTAQNQGPAKHILITCWDQTGIQTDPTPTKPTKQQENLEKARRTPQTHDFLYIYGCCSFILFCHVYQSPPPRKKHRQFEPQKKNKPVTIGFQNELCHRPNVRSYQNTYISAGGEGGLSSKAWRHPRQAWVGADPPYP